MGAGKQAVRAESCEDGEERTHMMAFVATEITQLQERVFSWEEPRKEERLEMGQHVWV